MCQFTKCKIGQIVSVEITYSNCIKCGSETPLGTAGHKDAEYAGHTQKGGITYDRVNFLDPVTCPGCGDKIEYGLFDCDRAYWAAEDLLRAIPVNWPTHVNKEQDAQLKANN